MVVSTATAAAIPASATAAAQSAALAVGLLLASGVASSARQLCAFAVSPLPLCIAVGVAAAPPSLKAAQKDRFVSHTGDTTNEHILEDDETFFEKRPILRISTRRSSAPARLEASDSVHFGDSATTDSFTQLTFSSLGSERTVDTATVSSSDGKSPFAEAGSWTEAWESWLHPAASLASNTTYSRGRQGLAAAAAARGFPKKLERPPQNETAEASEGEEADGDEANVKEAQPPGHCVGCLGQNPSSTPNDVVPFFDKAIVLPRQLDRNLLVNVTMDAGSVLLITSEGLVCHEANPVDLDRHVYAANAALDSCDFNYLLAWEQVYPLIPPSYILWRFSGHNYYFRKPGADFIQKDGRRFVCFTLEDAETHKIATFIIAANGAHSVLCSQTLTFSIAVTIFAGLFGYI